MKWVKVNQIRLRLCRMYIARQGFLIECEEHVYYAEPLSFLAQSPPTIVYPSHSDLSYHCKLLSSTRRILLMRQILSSSFRFPDRPRKLLGPSPGTFLSILPHAFPIQLPILLLLHRNLNQQHQQQQQQPLPLLGRPLHQLVA